MMNLFSLNSQLNRIKTQGLAQKHSDSKENSLWKQRKDDGTYKKMAKVNAELASMQEYVDRLNADAGDMIRRLSSDTPSMGAITSKLTSGQELSASEMEYLRKNNPELYAKAVQLAAERKNYREEIRRCATKEDMQRVRMNFLSGAFASAKQDPIVALARVNGINNETAEFVKSPEYAETPTEAERNEELKAAREEREEQIRPEEETEAKPTDRTEESIPADPADKADGMEEELPMPKLPGKGKTEFEFEQPDAAPDPSKHDSKPERPAADFSKAHVAYQKSMDDARHISRRR